MNDLMSKYAQVLLTTCLSVKENQPLVIMANNERIDFVRILVKQALSLGIHDIHLDIYDAQIKHDLLKYLSLEELKSSPYFNYHIWNEYATKNAAFLMLASETPSLMDDIPSSKLSAINVYSNDTRKIFNELRNESKIAWCIAAVPTLSWAQKIFPGKRNATELLWNQIFSICHINEEDPCTFWNNKIKKLNARCQKLNSYQFTKLKYSSSNGTNFQVSLPKNHLWASGQERLLDGREIIANFPTEEVFTSPDYRTAEGIVYSTRPLSYQGQMIDNFNITFKNGKAISCFAEVGDEALKSLITACPASDQLGEVALVPYDSPISNSHLTFYETLYDENAACHLALGASFSECLANSQDKSSEELKELGLNQCQSHTDFMVGNSDLNITGITASQEEIPIFQNGNFTSEFNNVN